MCCLSNVIIPLTDWAQNAHSLTVQSGQNAHCGPSLYYKGDSIERRPPLKFGAENAIRTSKLHAMSVHGLRLQTMYNHLRASSTGRRNQALKGCTHRPTMAFDE